MPQQLLKLKDIPPISQKLNSKSVPETMWMDAFYSSPCTQSLE